MYVEAALLKACVHATSELGITEIALKVGLVRTQQLHVTR
jgi:hypothetical protein